MDVNLTVNKLFLSLIPMEFKFRIRVCKYEWLFVKNRHFFCLLSVSILQV